MAWRGVHLSKSAKLSLADNCLVVVQDEGEVRLALEDIAWIVLDAAHTTLSSTLISACMTAGIVLIVTDGTHTPSGIMLPFHTHFRQAGLGIMQASLGAPLKKRLWQLMIKAKITNQAEALIKLGRPGEAPLREMVRMVGSGDPDNVEARAAREYWSCLFDDFRRDDDGDTRNMLLNYGYAVVRAGVARALVASGLLPALGIKHASVTNSFNLADDLVEPFRPFVDLLAWRASNGGLASRERLTLDQRRTMAAVLNGDCSLGPERMTLLTATEKAAASLVRAMESNFPEGLLVPSIQR